MLLFLFLLWSAKKFISAPTDRSSMKNSRSPRRRRGWHQFPPKNPHATISEICCNDTTPQSNLVASCTTSFFFNRRSAKFDPHVTKLHRIFALSADIKGNCIGLNFTFAWVFVFFSWELVRVNSIVIESARLGSSDLRHAVGVLIIKIKQKRSQLTFYITPSKSPVAASARLVMRRFN